MRNRLLALPLNSVFVTSKRPTSAVEATWVPPSAWRSRHDVHHADLGHGGDEVHLGADQVRVGQRLGPRPERHLHGTVRGDLGVHQLGHLGAEPLGQRTELEVPPGPSGSMFPPVTDAPDTPPALRGFRTLAERPLG